MEQLRRQILHSAPEDAGRNADLGAPQGRAVPELEKKKHSSSGPTPAAPTDLKQHNEYLQDLGSSPFYTYSLDLNSETAEL